MGILRAARERGVVTGVDRVLELAADLLPALAELVLARAAEEAVGEV